MDESRCRAIVSERCGGRCERCGAPQYTCHHRWKQGQGGPWEPANIVALCGSGTTGCHGWVEANPAAAIRLGFWLPSGAGVDTESDPAHRGKRIPEKARLWLWGRWVLLDNNGGIRLWVPKATVPIEK